MSPQLVVKVDRRAAGAELAIVNERRTIGEDLTNWIFPTEMPLESSPSSVVVTRVSDALNFSEVTVAPAALEFRVEYDPETRLGGGIEFNSADAGTIVDIDYKGTGSMVFARDLNQLRGKLSGSDSVDGQVWHAEATLNDGANIAWDLATRQTAKVTLAGNRTLDNPSNMKAGATYILRVIQDGTGSRTLAYGTAYKFPGGTDPVLSTAIGAIDILTFYSDGSSMYGVIQKAFS